VADEDRRQTGRMSPVAVVGAAALNARQGEKRLEELVFDVARAALDDAHLERADLDAVVLSGSDELDGRSISSMLTSMPAGGLLKDTAKITDSGLHALAVSSMRILAADTNIEIVVGWGVPSEGDPMAVERTALDPFYERHAGVVDAVATGMLLQNYLADSALSLDDVDARAAAKWSAAGVDGDAMDASFVAVPLRRSHIAPSIDAAAAVVLASDPAVGQRGLSVKARVLGLGWSTEDHSIASRERPGSAALRLAAAQALARAGVSPGALDSIEIEDRTVLHELLAVEAFDRAPRGVALEVLRDDASFVNRYTGDGFAGLPMHCSGLWRLAQICGRDDVGTAAVQNSSGIAGQSHAVVVVEGTHVN
jgi:acetyl-CoA acetyltransferase